MKICLEGERYSKLDPHALNLLTQMLEPSPSTRITAEQALQHPYFTQKPLVSIEVLKEVVSPCLTEPGAKLFL